MKYSYFLIFLGLACCLSSCIDEDDFITDSNVKLEFSLDTLRFDTVFTELGSATRFFKVYNRNNRPLKISRIFIEAGDESKFRLNIDGIPGNEIEGGRSAWQ